MAKLRKKTVEVERKPKEKEASTPNRNKNKQQQSIKNIKLRKLFVKVKRLNIKNIDLILNNNNIIEHPNSVLNIASAVKARTTSKKIQGLSPDKGTEKAIGLRTRNRISNNSTKQNPLQIAPLKPPLVSNRDISKSCEGKKIKRKGTSTQKQKPNHEITPKTSRMAKPKKTPVNMELNEGNKPIRVLRSRNIQNVGASLEKSKFNESVKKKLRFNMLEKSPASNEIQIDQQCNILENNSVPLLNETEIELMLEKDPVSLSNQIDSTIEKAGNQENVSPGNNIQRKFNRLSLKRYDRNCDGTSKIMTEKNFFKTPPEPNSRSSSMKFESNSFKKSKRLLNLESTATGSNSDKNNVYEYQLSQSSPPVDKNNPTKDIITKLVKEGKVKLVKYKSGSGKLQKPYKTSKKTVEKSMKKAKPKLLADEKKLNIPAKAASENPKKGTSNKFSDDNHLHNQNVEIAIDNDFNLESIHNELSVHNSSSSNLQAFNLQSPNLDISTDYSPLARKVMKKQTNKWPQRRRILDTQELLNYARKFVQTGRFDSTALQKKPYIKSPERIASADSKFPKKFNLSKGSPTLPSIKSPWRVPDDSKLPRSFNFSRDSHNLPSYSSDFIAATPKKSAGNEFILHDQTSAHDDFQLNDSNAENIPIENIRNVVEVNPHKGLPKRTPLKIIEVINLPRLALNQISTPKNKITLDRTTIIADNEQNGSPMIPLPDLPSTRTSYKRQNESKSCFLDLTRQSQAPELTSHFVDLTRQNQASELTSHFVDLTRQNQAPDMTENVSENIENLFGFEDELSKNDNAEYSKINDPADLKTKLKKLKRLLPKPKAKPTRFEMVKPLKNIFNDGSLKPKQSNIKQIFSSTMIDTELNKSSESINVLEPIDEAVSMADSNSNTINLFGDVTEINNSTLNSTIRTYSRPKKKIRHNFITCMESDEEETNKSPKKKNKGTKKDQANEKELSKFYDDFNLACEEVDHFELVVEKNKSVE